MGALTPGPAFDQVVGSRGRGLIAFDLDGTLIDSLEGIQASLAAACAMLQLKAPSLEQLRGHIGPPLRDYLPALLQLPKDEADVWIEPLLQRFRQHHDREGWRRYQLYGGTRELLQRLVQDRWSLHVVTNKPLVLAQQMLEREDLTVLIESLQAPGGMGWLGKTQALQALVGEDRRAHWYVGDTTPDQQAARSAGYRFVAATYGYGHCPDADARIDTPLQLLEVLR